MKKMTICFPIIVELDRNKQIIEFNLYEDFLSCSRGALIFYIHNQFDFRFLKLYSFEGE